MKITRSKFLGVLTTGTVATLLRARGLLGAGPATDLEAGTSPSLRDATGFRGSLGSTFTLVAGALTVDLVLENVAERRFAILPHAPKASQFSLTFSGPAGARIPEGAYSISRSPHGPFEIYIAPTGQASAGKLFHRADFSQLV